MERKRRLPHEFSTEIKEPRAFYEDPVIYLRSLCKTKGVSWAYREVKNIIECFGAEWLLSCERCCRLARGNDAFSSSPLLEAAENGNTEIVDYLLQNGWVLDILTTRGSHALHLAAYRGHLPIVKLLVEKYGTDPNILPDPPIVRAARNGHLHVVKFLHESGADPFLMERGNSNALHRAVGFGNLEVVRYLLEATELMHTECFNELGLSYIHVAAYYSHLGIAVVGELIKHGVNLDAVSNTRGTALHIAFQRRASYGFIHLLVSEGASVWIDGPEFTKVSDLQSFYPKLKKAVDDGCRDFRLRYKGVIESIELGLAVLHRHQEQMSDLYKHIRQIITQYLYHPTTVEHNTMFLKAKKN